MNVSNQRRCTFSKIASKESNFFSTACSQIQSRKDSIVWKDTLYENNYNVHYTKTNVTQIAELLKLQNEG